MNKCPVCTANTSEAYTLCAVCTRASVGGVTGDTKTQRIIKLAYEGVGRGTKEDPVNHPKHYTEVVPGVECIDVVENFSFCRGNAIKYLWRAGSKDNAVQDLEKAKWYIQREIDTLTKECKGAPGPTDASPSSSFA